MWCQGTVTHRRARKPSLRAAFLGATQRITQQGERQCLTTASPAFDTLADWFIPFTQVSPRGLLSVLHFEELMRRPLAVRRRM